MSLRAFAKFARFGQDLKDWTEIADVDTHVEHLYTERAEAALRASLSGLREAVAAGDVWVGRKDLYFRRDEAEIRPEGVDQAQNELYRKVGRIQLPTLLLELDSQVHFSWKLLGREPKSAEELLGVYGALLATGTDLQSTRRRDDDPRCP